MTGPSTANPLRAVRGAEARLLATPFPGWAWALSLLLALIFAATGLGKALDPLGFAMVLGNYRLFPEAFLVPLAFGLIFMEFGIALGLLVRTTRANAAGAAMALTLGNALVLALIVARGIELENCGCFGVFLARPWS